MAAVPSAGERMDRSFINLPYNISSADAQEQLQAANRQLGILVNDNEEPVGFIGPGGRMPLILVDVTTPLHTIFSTAEIMDELNLRIIQGIVVVDEDRPVGVLPIDALDDYLRREFRADSQTLSAESEPPDSELGGNPKPGRLSITCATCGTLNTRSSFVAGRTMCMNKMPGEHLLMRK